MTESTSITDVPKIMHFEAVDGEAAIGVDCGGLMYQVLSKSKSVAIVGPRKSKVRVFDVIKEHSLIVLTDQGRLLFSKDLGKKWVEVGKGPSGIAKRVLRMSFLDEKVGWIIDSFSVWVTKNGGTDWDRVYPSKTWSYDTLKTQPSTLFVLNSEIAFLGMSNGKVLRTVDSGKKWENISTNSSSDIKSIFAESKNSILVGSLGPDGGLYRTFDGGKNWNRLTVSGLYGNYSVKSISISHRSGWASGIGTVGSNSTNLQSSAVLISSSDAGASWKMSDSPKNTDGPFKKVDFRNIKSGWLATHSSVFHTIDGGVSWSLVANFANNECVSF